MVGYGAHMREKINPYSVHVEIYEENVEGSGMEDTGLDGVEWIHMAQDGIQWRVLVNTFRKVIQAFHREGDEICALQGCCAAYSGNSLPTFRDNLSVPSSRVKNPKKRRADR